MTVNEASELSHSSIRAYAEVVGKHFDIYDENGRASLQKILDKLPASIEVGGHLEDEESSNVTLEGHFKIFVSRYSSRQRDRFTVAHELGHYFVHFLHPKRVAPVKFNRGGTGLVETQANVFASSLLMPELSFRDKHRELNGDCEKLASTFDVSLAAVEVRAKVLGL